MARCTLHPNAKATVGDPVGDIDGKPLSFVDKTPYVDGQPVAFAEIGYAVSLAVEDAAVDVFGQEWSTDLGRVTGLNRRTVTRDRIERFGVAPWVYKMLGRARASRCPRGVGHMLLAAAEFCDRGPYSPGGSKPRPASIADRGRLRLLVEESMADAWIEVDEARTKRENYEKSRTGETED